jgi:hypothetical protein
MPPSKQLPVSQPKPEVDEYLKQVVALYVEAIPADAREKTFLYDGTPFPQKGTPEEKQKFLCRYVVQQLDRIARFEYSEWLNGKMPFVSPRQMQLWRLRQFAEFIWDWYLPDDEDLATIFNLTKRQAGNLAGDFHAKFRKVFLYPRILRILLKLLDKSANKAGQRGVTMYGDSLGSLYQIPSKRYVDELNAVIAEVRDIRPGKILRDATIYRRNNQLMWVDDEVIEMLNDSTITEELVNRHPIGGDDD